MKFKTLKMLSASSLIVVMAATSANATSLDVRQEYKHDSEKSASRIKISASVGNHGFGLEAKQKQRTKGPLSDVEAGDSEFTYSYKHVISPVLYLKPEVPVTFGGGKTAIKPQVKVAYKVNDNTELTLRYRHEFDFYTASKKTKDEQKGKITADYNWKFQDFAGTVEYNYDIAYDSDHKLYNNKNKSWELNLKVAYQQKDWKFKPYFEVGTVGMSSSNDDREIRTRYGISFSL